MFLIDNGFKDVDNMLFKMYMYVRVLMETVLHPTLLINGYDSCTENKKISYDFAAHAPTPVHCDSFHWKANCWHFIKLILI